MPDTKSGREKKGLNKQKQLARELYEKELSALEEERDLPFEFTDQSGEFIADELPEE
jgi:hypothetical protein